jgi:hypothetical protein
MGRKPEIPCNKGSPTTSRYEKETGYRDQRNKVMAVIYPDCGSQYGGSIEMRKAMGT